MRRQLLEYYANPSASLGDTWLTLVELLWRRFYDGGPEALTEHDWTCLHVHVFDADLCSDGFAAWIQNACDGYGFPVMDTLHSLKRIGAPWAAALGDVAIHTVPAPARAALVAGRAPVPVEAFPQGLRRAEPIAALDSAYQRRCTYLESAGGIDALIVR